MLGGARSGKSAHAEHLVDEDDTVHYVATARAHPADEDFTARIAEHRARRPAHWSTVEGADLVELLRRGFGGATVLVDDLGTWLTHALDDAKAWDAPRGTIAELCDTLVRAVATSRDRLVIVTPEVGLGVVPATGAGRLFRDELGSLNALVAQECDEVVLLVAGIPLRLH